MNPAKITIELMPQLQCYPLRLKKSINNKPSRTLATRKRYSCTGKDFMRKSYRINIATCSKKYRRKSLV